MKIISNGFFAVLSVVLMALAVASDAAAADSGRPFSDNDPEVGPYDQSAGMLVIEALSRAYGDNPDLIGGFIGNRRCPSFLEGMYFDGATLVLQVRGDTVRARRRLEADAGSKAFRIEKLRDGVFSQKQLEKLMDVIDRRSEKTDDPLLRGNLWCWGMGAKYIDVSFMLNTAEAQKAFRDKILDSPAIRFCGPPFPLPDATTGVADTLGVSLIPKYTAWPTASDTATFLLMNRGPYNISCGAEYKVTFEDEHGVWRELPSGGIFNSMAYGVLPGGSRRIVARLNPGVNRNRTGRYRLLYKVDIGSAKDIMMMADFRLTSDSTEQAGIRETVIPTATGDTVTVGGYEQTAIYDIVEQMPEFPGGVSAMQEYLRNNLSIPDSIDIGEIQGQAVVGFVVSTDGSLTDVSLLRSACPVLDREAMRLVRAMPRWTPGRQNGRPVRVRYAVPVDFGQHTQIK